MKFFKIGIDFGGEYLRIFSQKGLIFKEHSLIAVKKEQNQYLTIATGENAKLLQKEKNVLVFSPVIEGQIESPQYASLLLKHALNKVSSNFPPSSKLFAIISVPSSLDIEQKKLFIYVCKMAGIDKVDIVSTPICTLLGTKIFMPEDEVLIADLGASKCDFQIMKDYHIQKNATLGLGGNSIKSAINQMMLEQRSFITDEENTVLLEKNLASLLENDNNFFTIEGVSTTRHGKAKISLTSGDLFPITQGFFEEVCLVINTLIGEYSQEPQNFPAILVSGGLARTKGLMEFLKAKFPKAKIVIETDSDTLWSNAFQQLLY